MAKFINTRKAVSELEDLIKDAGEKLFLISPYLKLSKDFRELLAYRNSKDKVTTIIFGKQELNPDEMKFLQSLRFVVLRYNESLHAKCYVNEDKIIITSLNLYQFSMANNKEMGVLIDRHDASDSQLFEEAMKEVNYITETSQRFELNGTKTSIFSKPIDDSSFKKAQKPNARFGYCIRKGVEIPFNVDRPLSYEAFKKWNEFGDPNYSEQYCHFSGELSNGETSVNRPIMKKNWKKAQELFNL